MSDQAAPRMPLAAAFAAVQDLLFLTPAAAADAIAGVIRMERFSTEREEGFAVVFMPLKHVDAVMAVLEPGHRRTDSFSTITVPGVSR